MSKYLIALAIASAMSAPLAAQTVQNAPTSNQAQPAQPQMVKKRVCEDNDNPSTTIHRVCHTIMVPAQPSGSASNQKPQASDQQPNAGY